VQGLLRSIDLEMGPVYLDGGSQIVEGQRRVNCAREFPSVVKPASGFRGRVAIVGYGPSLVDTWEGIATGGFDAVWTTSKAHDFLRERGVVPTHHTDTEYREHKAKFNKRFGPETQYLIGTQVHPSYLDALVGQRVSLFHVDLEDGRFYDPRYLKLPAAFDAGLTAARLAFAFGYREQEWFGMDASARSKKSAHAGPHEGLVPEYIDIIVAGVPRITSTLLIRQAFWAEKVLCKHPHMKVKIHGDGMLRPFLQERAKCSVS